MGRVVRPLRGMGADIMGRQNGDYAPLGIRPARMRGVEYDMPVASAQVKSCVILAGLYSQGLTVVREPGPARDHTERMLAAMGAPVHVYGRKVTSERPDKPLSALDITVPGDLSSAAFLLAAAAIVPGSHITIRDVGVNPTRTGWSTRCKRWVRRSSIITSASRAANPWPTSKYVPANSTARPSAGSRSLP